MELLSWNNLLKQWKADVIFLQETKLEHFVDWLFVGSIGASGVDDVVGDYSVSGRFKILSSGFEWAFTGVYGPTSNADKRLMGEELAGVNSWWDVSWCVGRDFNVVRFPRERMGAEFITPAMRGFPDFIFEHGLMDFPSEGGAFTWSNSLSRSWIDRGRSPFRFENTWLKADGFTDLVKNWWDSSVSWYAKLSRQKVSLLGCILAVDEIEETRTLLEGEQCEHYQAKADLERIMLMEEISWRQKSRLLCLKEGDKNTKFFHRLANSHRRNNTIGQLLALYSESSIHRPLLDGTEFSVLEDKMSCWLERCFSEDEVFEVVSNMNGDRAPSLDGFTMSFFQSCWGILKEDVKKVFHYLHAHGYFEKSLNATFITLIPKKPGAVEIKDFQPISLISGVYKILAKVLANRLEKDLNKVVSEPQNAFVKERQMMEAVDFFMYFHSSFFCACYGGPQPDVRES
ncbi:hypothetical protein RGQ29_003530 [Quercus rubra]|uniref:Reverse transcriptase domain-containing protein n=1 Tax=Quercus rubra TaxID=3512 RepID=A0AAN7ECB0_QUERU|nr:hypothetical protein RGQ29_003530 [Quercus rubra]